MKAAAPPRAPTYPGVPEPLQVHLRRIHEEVTSPRPVIRNIMMELARSRAAYSPESCGCAGIADPDARLWLHTHHPDYEQHLLRLIPEEVLRKVFQVINSADPKVDAPGFWNAASARRLQDWLAVHLPRKHLLRGKDTEGRQGRRPRTPTAGPKPGENP